MSNKCKYYRESPVFTYVPSCCVEDGVAINDVHSMDVGKFCQFCGKKVKLKEYKAHPDLQEDEE